jgi:hypothetical protein
VPPDQGPLLGRLVLIGLAMSLGCVVLIIVLWVGS